MQHYKLRFDKEVAASTSIGSDMAEFFAVCQPNRRPTATMGDRPMLLDIIACCTTGISDATASFSMGVWVGQPFSCVLRSQNPSNYVGCSGEHQEYLTLSVTNADT